jgi:Subtilase family
LSCFRDLRPLLGRLPIFVALLLMSASATLQSQIPQGTKDNGTDLKFHKFQSPVQPEAAVIVGATQAQSDALTTQQITAIEQEKSSRTAAQQKIDSNVLYTARMLAGKAAAPGIAAMDTGVDVDDANNLIVDITANVTGPLLQQLNAAGALVWYSNARFRSIRAVVPSTQIENIASSPDVIFIAPKAESMTAGAHWLQPGPVGSPRPSFALRSARIRKQLAAAILARAEAATSGTGQGSVTTQGDATHRAFDARGTFSINGAGLKIGVLSDSANATGALNLAQLSGDMPPTCPAGPPCFTMLHDFANGTDEGLAMMEIVYDMAPGASLFFATADTSEASFAQNILDLRTAGCDIIIDDVFYFDEPVFEDGIVAQAVNSVTADGALYFSSAGNEGNVDSGTAGYFEGDFNDAGSPAFTFPGGTKTGTIHNFGTVANPVNGNIITVAGNAYTLNWADPEGASSNDYDLFLVSSTGAVKASSTNLQIGGQNPFEQINPQTLAAGDRLVVFKAASAVNRYFAINTLRGRLTVNTPGQTHGHSSAAGEAVYSVAATPAADPFAIDNPIGPFPNPFNASNNIELFTSDGPRRIFFNADGSAITPGDFSSTGGAVRNKPDITGADGVSTTLPALSGLNPFYGTSAAAPSAASVAALVKSANPALSQSAIRTALTSTAVDIMAPGNDRDSGAGIVMAFEAVNSLGATATANPILGAITAAENPGNGNGVIEAGEGGRLTIQLKNVGLVNATGVTATLTTPTPGVTVTLPGASAYPNLVAGSGAAINAAPFTFTVQSDAACALVIHFTLTVNYTGGPQRALTFTVPTGTVTFTNNLGTLPTPALGVTTATGQQTNRVTRSGAASACSVSNAYPGTTAAGSRTFDSYKFTACKSSCVTPVLSSANTANMFEVGYAGAFDPATISTSYAADAGGSSDPQSFGLNTTAGNFYTVVVSDVSGAGAGSNYSLQLPACALNCNINHVPVAIAQNATVASTTVGGSANASINNGSSDADGDPLTITQIPAGPYPHGDTNVTLTVTDTKGAAAQATAVVTVVDPGAAIDNFAFAPTLSSVNVVPGQSATEHFTFTPSPSTATATTFSCSGLPAFASCAFAPGSAPAGNTPLDIVLTISTTATTASALQQPRTFYAMWLPLGSLGTVGLVLVGARKQSRMRLVIFAILAMAFMALSLSGCGGGSHQTSTQAGTPAGSFTVTATATSGTGVVRSTTFTLVVQ